MKFSKSTGVTFLQGGKKVVGVEPSYSSVYQHASGIKADVVALPLLADYRQDIPAMIRATKDHYRDVGFVYLCQPEQPDRRDRDQAGSQARCSTGFPRTCPS